MPILDCAIRHLQISTHITQINGIKQQPISHAVIARPVEPDAKLELVHMDKKNPRTIGP
uniref:Uncharacterized protein n=1 Tax=Arundo donax TaxID=35708 RepID=A0A0A9FMW8_ARUDO